jgi:hypothetical protein
MCGIMCGEQSTDEIRHAATPLSLLIMASYRAVRPAKLDSRLNPKAPAAGTGPPASQASSASMLPARQQKCSTVSPDCGSCTLIKNGKRPTRRLISRASPTLRQYSDRRASWLTEKLPSYDNTTVTFVVRGSAIIMKDMITLVGYTKRTITRTGAPPQPFV